MSMSTRRVSELAGILTLCGLLAACGAREPATPGAPGAVSPTPTSPTPTPSPALTSAGYLHVLQAPWVVTYEIDGTGRLRPPVTQAGAHGIALIAGEPRGRFVFATESGYEGRSLSYEPAREDGTLRKVSEVPVWGTSIFEVCPSCFFLYVVDAASRLRTYAMDAGGRVELTMSLEGAGGSLAITTPR